MGSTLPLLVEHFVRHTGMGESRSALLFGQYFRFRRRLSRRRTTPHADAGRSGFGQPRLFASIYSLEPWRIVRPSETSAPVKPNKLRKQKRHLTANASVLDRHILAGIIGFIALAYEIVWYRLYSFTTGGTACLLRAMLALLSVRNRLWFTGSPETPAEGSWATTSAAPCGRRASDVIS